MKKVESILATMVARSKSVIRSQPEKFAFLVERLTQKATMRCAPYTYTQEITAI